VPRTASHCLALESKEAWKGVAAVAARITLPKDRLRRASLCMSLLYSGRAVFADGFVSTTRGAKLAAPFVVEESGHVGNLLTPWRCGIIGGRFRQKMTVKSTKARPSNDVRRASARRQRALALHQGYKSKNVAGSIYLGDALDFMRSLPSQSAGIIFLDPPFNLGKVYGSDGPKSDLRPEAEYSGWMCQVLDESVRVLEQGGTLYLYHMPIWGIRFGAQLEKKLQLRHWVAISMKNGFVRGRRLYPAHYSLLMLSKGAPTVLNRPKTAPAECRHCGKYIKDYGGYRSIIEEKGINLSDFWDDVSPVRHARRKNRTANELPPIIFDRVMQISSQPGSLYVDPFAGSGGGVVAAVAAGMSFAACDIVASNCRLIARRLRELKDVRRRRTSLSPDAELVITPLETQGSSRKGV
jgi:site-specific DNA-methyltransferase (adenine-specific)